MAALAAVAAHSNRVRLLGPGVATIDWDDQAVQTTPR